MAASPPPVRPADLADVAAGDHPGLEGHQVARLDRHVPARPVPRVPARGDPGDVLGGGGGHSRRAIASMNTPVSWRSVTPGASADSRLSQ